MSFLNALSFNFQQIIAVLGLVQAVYALVYIVFRSGNLMKAWSVMLYFSIFVVALLIDFSLDLFPKHKANLFYMGSGFWLCLPIVGYLISIQIIRIEKLPRLREICLVTFPVVAVLSMCIANIISYSDNIWVGANLLALLCGSLSLFAIVVVLSRELDVEVAKSHVQQRYWLVICLILASSGLLSLFLFEQLGFLSKGDLIVSRGLLALVFIYLVSTSLFRLYPQAAFLSKRKSSQIYDSEEISKLRYVLENEKLYQEQNFGRRELAQEMSLSEAVVSELVNSVYKKSIPQLLKEYRINDAKLLLKQTRMSAKDIAAESGFGSLTSFNRAFQSIVGQTPTQYRRN